ncbi:MAG: YdeI/OmpD-associated family protein [Planctomycetota bacterium]
MKNTSLEVDAYIDDTPEFAQPILKRLRRLIHKGCPQIVETIKWGVPSFDHHGIVIGFAAFKQHVGFGFWKAKLLSDPHGLLKTAQQASVMGVKVRSVDDLPDDAILVEYVREAALLNEQGVKLPKPKRTAVKPPTVPEDLQALLKKNAKARATFETLSPSCRCEYIEWITEAKQLSTRQRRLATTLEWLAEGKSRNRKYERK